MVMGWFSSLVSGVASVVSTVVKASSTLVKKGKEMAAKAIGWLADEAETFVGDVQKVWRTVQPYISSALALGQSSGGGSGARVGVRGKPG
jgi:hypothetical protein